MKKAIYILFIIFPFLDVITALLTRNYDLTFTPGLIIKGLFMVGMFFYVIISKSKYKKLSLVSFSIFFVYLIAYFIFKPELLSLNFIFNEFNYLFKLLFFPLIFLSLLCFFDEYNFKKEEIIKIMKINLISMTLLLIIPLLLNNAYTTYPNDLKGYIGWFYAGNEIANIMILLFPCVYFFINEKYKYHFLIALPIIYIILAIGTKVSLFGVIIVSIISLIYAYLKYKNIKPFKYKYHFLILIFVILFSYNSYAVYNYKYSLNYQVKTEIINIDDKHKDEVSNILSDINSFYDTNRFNLIFKTLLSGRDIYLANTLSIYNDDLTISNIWFGIGFSNTDKVNNTNITKLIEVDVLDGYFHYGIIGLLIMFSPFILTSYFIIINKKITLNSIYLILILFLGFGISCLSGHVFTAPAVSIYLIFYLLLLLNEFKCIGRNKELKDKISILSLHMGYGGIERSIVNQANMLSQNYKVEIISLYKLNIENPYQLNENVKLIYLSDLKPNKEEFLKYFHNKNILKIITEGLKAIKILYLKKQLISDYIYNSDSKIIISTRLEFTKLLNKYYNANSIRIAEEHVYHNNSIKYINKLKKALKNIDYLIPASKYLTNDYNKYFQNEKIKILYIPQTIGDIPKLSNKCNNYNIIAVGRLVKEKGFTDLIEVMDIIVKKNNKIKLTIVGDGYQKEIIDKLIKDKKLSHNITLKGYLNSNELVKEYKKASLFVMTSLEESFGLVLIEAMSYGIPCIAFDSALGAKEIINGKSGILIKKRNKEKMAKEILNYFESNPNNEMSKEAKMHSEAYSNKQVKTIWDKFIINLLKY
ncbi:MAG: O-antigen ligase family protein [Proteiniphilum sp.]|nr:O-antigen ligase family protein [Proteiniphilum sp.]MDD4417031.1 O-antigen ligase family protein [Proteiniphilum sp.]